MNEARLFPQSKDIERAILGAMLIDTDAIMKVVDKIDADVFFLPTHQIIFSTIKGLYDSNMPVDQLTLVNKLEQKGELDLVGGEAMIAALMSETASAGNVMHHIKIIRDKALKRSLILIVKAVEEVCYEDRHEATQIVSQLENRIIALTGNIANTDYVEASAVVGEVYSDLERITENGGKFEGIPAGFPCLDKLLGGWLDSDLIILSGKTSHGKTALALNFVQNVAEQNIAVGIFSFEMSRKQLIKRIVQSDSGVNLKKVFSEAGFSQKEWGKLNKSCSKIHNLPILINDHGGISIDDLRTRARRMKHEHNVGLFIVDYLQLVDGVGGSREQEVASISRGLKALAMNLNVPVIALSQFNRKVDDIKGMPKLSHLRESGAIEQDANIVLFIYDRHDDYDKVHHYGFKENNENVRELFIAKNRDGVVHDTVLLQWDKETTHFGELCMRDINNEPEE